MKKAIEMLDEVKESIINAYEIRTNLSRTKLSHLMDSETWMNANKAIELGFVDGIIEDERQYTPTIPAYAFSRKTVASNLMNKIAEKAKEPVTKVTKPTGRSVDELKLSLYKNQI